ncbi:MAG: recombinase family protein, partial [Lachnospiraceae bacterium]|nr:recombinase family protein [Lachnospiraceae bacterium]
MGNSSIKVYGYIRVSTEGQVKQGYSLAEQQAEIERYCKEQGYNLIAIFKDEGISGAKANEDEMSIERDGLLDMLASLKEKDIQYIVVLSTNRLWRSDLVKVLLHRELKKNNVDIKAIDRPNYSIYTQNPNEIFVNGMFELLDVYERLEIALKLKRGRLQKAKGGGYAGGGAPFGYYCKRGGKKLYINTTEARAVQRVFQLKQLMPDMSLKNIAVFMNTEGYKGRKGTDFNVMLVKRILDKETFYRGYYNYGGIESVG